MSMLSFDPIAHVYEQTRKLPEAVEQAVIQTIASVAQASKHPTFLDVGIGTGRLTFPLASLGGTFTGVDGSPKMLEQLERKLTSTGWQQSERLWGSLPDEDPASTPRVCRYTQTEPPACMRLVLADVAHLPFRSASFDVVIEASVFHLVDDWQATLQETLRVLRSGGCLLRCVEEEQLPAPIQRLNMVWHECLNALGWFAAGDSSMVTGTRFVHRAMLCCELGKDDHTTEEDLAVGEALSGGNLDDAR